MFICEQCSKQSKPKQKQFHKVIEVKFVTHVDTYRDKNKRLKVEKTANKPQILKEIKVCKECANA